MELAPKSVKINIKMVVWLSIIVFVLCLVGVLLRVKLETLLDSYVSRQVSQQAILIADLSTDKVRMRMVPKALNLIVPRGLRFFDQPQPETDASRSAV